MIDLLLQALTAVAALLIFARAEPALNRMSAGTPILLRAAMHLLTVGAVATAGCILLFRYVPTAGQAVTTVGIALLLVCERRLRVLVPPRHPGAPGRGPKGLSR
jgi:hypothetical protein